VPASSCPEAHRARIDAASGRSYVRSVEEAVMSGFQFQETMSGSYTREGVERPIAFTARVRAPSLRRHLRDHTATIEGHVDAEGLAHHAVLAGTIIIDLLAGHRIRYEFGFTGDDGKPYRLAGQKDVRLAELVATMTTLPAEITDEKGTRWASALLKFDKRTLPDFLRSFRPIL
jgi:hypothetical protein